MTFKPRETDFAKIGRKIAREEMMAAIDEIDSLTHDLEVVAGLHEEGSEMHDWLTGVLEGLSDLREKCQQVEIPDEGENA